MTIADDQSTEISPDVLERVYDRRRPGPRPDIHPDLLPTYRGIVPEDADDDDALNPARGVLLGLILAVPCWGVVVAVVWWLVG
jgi:streptomycin 6-kinase